MIRVISCNVNGIRSAAKKGFFSWLSKQNADIICLQETRFSSPAITEHILLKGYHAYFCDAEKAGYSGVAIYSKTQPDKIYRGLGWKEADTEGRYIQADFKDLSIASLYLPSGTSGDLRQAIKYDFMDRYEKLLAQQAKDGRRYILCGDWNIAHKPIDLKNWRANQKASGFLPEERAWFDKLFGPMGYVDAFRVLNQNPDEYTWWSQRSRTARANNIGWRIDYHVITDNLTNTLQAASIYKDEFFSDHAPVIIDYKLQL